jgi:hypothetical protein
MADPLDRRPPGRVGADEVGHQRRLQLLGRRLLQPLEDPLGRGTQLEGIGPQHRIQPGLLGQHPRQRLCVAIGAVEDAGESAQTPHRRIDAQPGEEAGLDAQVHQQQPPCPLAVFALFQASAAQHPGQPRPLGPGTAIPDRQQIVAPDLLQTGGVQPLKPAQPLGQVVEIGLFVKAETTQRWKRGQRPLHQRLLVAEQVVGGLLHPTAGLHPPRQHQPQHPRPRPQVGPMLAVVLRPRPTPAPCHLIGPEHLEVAHRIAMEVQVGQGTAGHQHVIEDLNLPGRRLPRRRRPPAAARREGAGRPPATAGSHGRAAPYRVSAARLGRRA